MNKLIAISGPTMSGKTGYAIQLAKRFNESIVSADSRAVIKGLSIGTNKPIIDYPYSKKGDIYLIDGVDHYGLDLVDPGERFTVQDFQQYVEQSIKKIRSEKKVPIIVGGTGLYIEAVLAKYKFESKNDKAKKLSTDPSQLLIVLDIPREELYARADRQIKRWLELGLLDEIDLLKRKGFTVEQFKQLGLVYFLTWQFNEGQLDKKDYITKLEYSLHGLIRRQLTWWRRWPDANWLTSYTEVEKLVDNFL